MKVWTFGRTTEPDMKESVLTSVLTCPVCGDRREETMPTNACQFFWECPACQGVIRPMAGDCCVFCSYGTVACPPVQETGSCQR